MKTLLKKIFNTLVDIIFYILKIIPNTFKFLWNIIKNADNISQIVLRVLLLLILTSSVLFMTFGRMYNLMKKGFYFEKCSSQEEVLEKLLAIHPKETGTLDDYLNTIAKAGGVCGPTNDKDGSFYSCRYTQNLLLAKSYWNIKIRTLATSPQKISKITVNKSTKSKFFDFMDDSKDKINTAKEKTAEFITINNNSKKK